MAKEKNAPAGQTGGKGRSKPNIPLEKDLVNTEPPYIMVNHALKYAELGFSVFPCYSIGANGLCTCGTTDCKNPGKHPLTTHGLKDASTDEATISSWWAKWPNANIAIKTGNGLAVIDVDAGGEAFIVGKKLPETVQVVTGSGGRHYLYKTEVPLRSFADKKTCVDSRADGGYIVAPPSLHKMGNPYEFVPGHSFDELGVAPAPQWFIEYAAYHDPEGSDKAPIELTEQLSTKLLEGLHKAKSTGAFADYDDWIRLGMALKSSGYADTDYAALSNDEARDEALSKWKSFRESRVTVGTLFHFIKTNARAFYDENLKPLILRKTAGQVTFTDILDIELGPPKWVIRGFLEQDGTIFLVGESTSGKSFLALDWALSIATGRAWQGQVIDYPGPVAYIAGEGRGGIKRRVEAWRLFTGQTIDRGRFLLSAGVDLMQGTGAIVKAAQAIGVTPALVVFDTLNRNCTGDENSATDWAIVQRGLDSIRETFPGVSILVVHHVGLTEKDRQRGTGAKRGGADQEYILDRRNTALSVLTCKKMKEGLEPEPVALAWKVIALNLLDQDGKQVSSCTFDRVYDAPPAATLGTDAKLLLQIISDHGTGWMDWSDVLKAWTGTAKKETRGLEALTKAKIVEVIKSQGERQRILQVRIVPNSPKKTQPTETAENQGVEWE